LTIVSSPDERKAFERAAALAVLAIDLLARAREEKLDPSRPADMKAEREREEKT
jgi:hypothetical protein